MSSWTLEGELQALGGSADLAESLEALRLIEDRSRPFELLVTRDWYQGGAETYVLIFKVRQPDASQAYVVKACTAWAPLGGLAAIFQTWLDRRMVVTGLGIATPRLVGTSNAQLVEEFVEYELLDALARADTKNRGVLLTNLGRTAGSLVKGGFAPLSSHDWRSRGTDVVLIDFGQDLGPARIAAGTESGLLSELLDSIERRGIELTDDELHAAGAAYECALSD